MTHPFYALIHAVQIIGEVLAVALLFAGAYIGLGKLPLSTTDGSLDESLASQYVHGDYQVEYPDSTRSQPFNHATALNYASLFGGKVVPRHTPKVSGELAGSTAPAEFVNRDFDSDLS